MVIRDRKEVFQDYYDECLEAGMPPGQAEQAAYGRMVDYFAAMADDAHDRAKERDL